MNRYYLVDCNNFYVSCERVFDPTLHKKPVVVLSSNDACVIARSNEVKALGIQMGAPAFECETLFKKHKVLVYSANFALYGDMSSRVMQTLTECATDIELYSVDEAFLFIPNYINTDSSAKTYHLAYAHYIRMRVKQETGIPVSVGIGNTKTLAKIANRLAKKNPYHNGAFDITDHPDIDKYLASIDIGDVWGIGHRYATLLQNHNIMNARDFKYADETWVRKNMTLVGLKTLLELRGIPCLPLTDGPEAKQSITVSRSFGQKVTELRDAKEALASYVSTAAEKLRAQHSLTTHLTVYAVTTRYHDPLNYFQSARIQLPIATDYTPDLIAAAQTCLEKIFKKGFIYKKVGILCTDLVPNNFLQTSTIVPIKKNILKQTRSIKTIDSVNNKWGRNTLFFAALGTNQPWKMHQARKSACFTTNWHELLTIHL